MFYLRYLRIVVSNTYCVVVSGLFVFVLCTICCQFLWIVQFFYCPFGILLRLFSTYNLTTCIKKRGRTTLLVSQ